MVSPTPARRPPTPVDHQLPPGLGEVEERPKPRINVSDPERWISSLAGGGLIFLGLRSRSIPGWIAAGVGGSLIWRGATGHCPLYSRIGRDTAHPRGTALDVGATPEAYSERGIHITSAVTVNRTPEELYAYWRDFENLPRVMSHLERVEVLDERRSRWSTEAPLGRTVSWEAEIINDEPNRLIAWRSLEDADVDSAGSVRFIPSPQGGPRGGAEGRRGTQVKVVLDYIPPGGRIGQGIARLFGESPQQQIDEDLRRFKQQIEAGEIATNADGEPRGTC